MSTTSWVSALAAVIIIGFGAWWYVAQAPTAATINPDSIGAGGTGSNTDEGMPDDGVTVGVQANVSTAPATAAVTYGSGGFSPAEVTIKKGGTVTWTNQSGGNMWVASAMHPAHAGYSGTTLAQHCGDAVDVSFDQCKNGASYSFTFDKAGTWAYHNHSVTGNFGKVIVTE